MGSGIPQFVELLSDQNFSCSYCCGQVAKFLIGVSKRPCCAANPLRCLGLRETQRQTRFKTYKPPAWVIFLPKFVQESWSLTEVQRRCGLSPKGSGAQVRYWIKNKGLDTSHFIGREVGKFKKHPEEEVFCRNSLHRDAARDRFRKETPDVCVKCRGGNVWDGEPLTLQIDHENGDPFDCRRENMRKLCPNCHTQTNTWGARNGEPWSPERRRKHAERVFSRRGIAYVQR
jgi:hypothetical protein